MIRLLIALILSIACVHAEQEDEVLRECGNLHHLEFRNLPNANATFSNRNCALKCAVGDKTLSDDALNEGFPCPIESSGICHNCQCIGSQTDALRECSNVHHIDMHSAHSSGSSYGNNQCSLRCVISGSVISENQLNEGFACPTEPNGICRNGRCVLKNQPATATPSPTSGQIHNIHELQVKVVSASLPNSYSFVSALACIEENRQNNAVHSYLNCQKRCATTQIPRVTNNPVWNYNCFLKGPFPNEKDVLLVTVLYRHSNRNYVLGIFQENVQSLYNRLYPLSTHRNTSDLFYLSEFPLTQLDGSQHQNGNITLDLAILLVH